MYKSGLIFSVIAFLLAIGATLLSPLCVPCLALLLGLGAGYLAGYFDKPVSNRDSSKTGALAGVIGGVGALVGQAVGAIINGFVVGPEKAAELARQLGLPTGPADTFGPAYWGGVIGSAGCMGVLDVLLMAGLGALGGLLWWQTSGKSTLGTPGSLSS